MRKTLFFDIKSNDSFVPYRTRRPCRAEQNDNMIFFSSEKNADTIIFHYWGKRFFASPQWKYDFYFTSLPPVNLYTYGINFENMRVSLMLKDETWPRTYVFKKHALLSLFKLFTWNLFLCWQVENISDLLLKKHFFLSKYYVFPPDTN